MIRVKKLTVICILASLWAATPLVSADPPPEDLPWSVSPEEREGWGEEAKWDPNDPEDKPPLPMPEPTEEGVEEQLERIRRESDVPPWMLEPGGVEGEIQRRIEEATIPGQEDRPLIQACVRTLIVLDPAWSEENPVGKTGELADDHVLRSLEIVTEIFADSGVFFVSCGIHRAKSDDVVLRFNGHESDRGLDAILTEESKLTVAGDGENRFVADRSGAKVEKISEAVAAYMDVNRPCEHLQLNPRDHFESECIILVFVPAIVDPELAGLGDRPGRVCWIDTEAKIEYRMGDTVTHEIGHNLGLHHPSATHDPDAAGDKNNVMSGEPDPGPPPRSDVRRSTVASQTDSIRQVLENENWPDDPALQGFDNRHAHRHDVLSRPMTRNEAAQSVADDIEANRGFDNWLTARYAEIEQRLREIEDELRQRIKELLQDEKFAKKIKEALKKLAKDIDKLRADRTKALEKVAEAVGGEVHERMKEVEDFEVELRELEDETERDDMRDDLIRFGEIEDEIDDLEREEPEGWDADRKTLREEQDALEEKWKDAGSEQKKLWRRLDGDAQGYVNARDWLEDGANEQAIDDYRQALEDAKQEEDEETGQSVLEAFDAELREAIRHRIWRILLKDDEIGSRADESQDLREEREAISRLADAWVHPPRPNYE